MGKGRWMIANKPELSMPKDLMLVQVTKARKGKWYQPLVGAVFCVKRKREYGNNFAVFPGSLGEYLIHSSDCREVIAVPKESQHEE